MNEQEFIEKISHVIGEPCLTLAEVFAVTRSVVRDIEDSKWFWYERHARTRRMVEKGAYVRQELRRAERAFEAGHGTKAEVFRAWDALVAFADECVLEFRYLDSWPQRGPFLLPERCPQYCVACKAEVAGDEFCDSCAAEASACP